MITSSGTAVANLLPAVVEASQSNIPMLLITADRPSEMRDSGANQTIDQVKIFGGYTRWAVDVPPPDHIVPVRGLLTTTDAAVRFATGNPAGPVHMNCQFREPLAPAVADWPQALLKVHLCTHLRCPAARHCVSSTDIFFLACCCICWLWWPSHCHQHHSRTVAPMCFFRSPGPAKRAVLIS